MKPDAYMQWYWDTFWGAVVGMPDHIIVAYQRCISHYYHHNHCAGLEDNERKLRSICQATDKPDEVWFEMRDYIFSNGEFFFQDENGLWHQKRASDEWHKAVENYNNACKRTEAARQAKLKKLSHPPRRRT